MIRESNNYEFVAVCDVAGCNVCVSGGIFPTKSVARTAAISKWRANKHCYLEKMDITLCKKHAKKHGLKFYECCGANAVSDLCLEPTYAANENDLKEQGWVAISKDDKQFRAAFAKLKKKWWSAAEWDINQFDVWYFCPQCAKSIMSGKPRIFVEP